MDARSRQAEKAIDEFKAEVIECFWFTLLVLYLLLFTCVYCDLVSVFVYCPGIRVETHNMTQKQELCWGRGSLPTFDQRTDLNLVSYLPLEFPGNRNLYVH